MGIRYHNHGYILYKRTVTAVEVPRQTLFVPEVVFPEEAWFEQITGVRAGCEAATLVAAAIF